MQKRDPSFFKENTRINKSHHIHVYAYNETRLQTKLNRHARKARIRARNVYFIVQTSGEVEANETTQTYTSVVVIVFVQTSYIYLPANIRVSPSLCGYLSSIIIVHNIIIKLVPNVLIYSLLACCRELGALTFRVHFYFCSCGLVLM